MNRHRYLIGLAAMTALGVGCGSGDNGDAGWADTGASPVDGGGGTTDGAARDSGPRDAGRDTGMTVTEDAMIDAAVIDDASTVDAFVEVGEGGAPDAFVDIDASIDDAGPAADAFVPSDAHVDCTATQYRNASGACVDLTVCTSNQYQSTAPTTTSDRVCSALDVCTSTQYESTAPTATSNRVCSDLAVCTSNQYESAAPTATSNRVCTALTVCTSAQYQSTAPTATSDRACTALTVCTSAQYQSVAPTATSDRVCSPVGGCAAGYYILTESTPTSDRTCAACASGSYSSEPNSSACTTWTACTAPGQYESTAGTTTTDRVCSSCGAGTANCDGTGVCEVDTNTSNANCGACGNVCSGIQTCNSGVCSAPVVTGPTFVIPSLGTSQCARVEHNTVTGDDRGGIAVSSTRVFYTGDAATGSFSRADVSGGVSVGAQYDGIFSNLSNEQVYAFTTALGATSFAFSNVTIDRFVALDGATGAPGTVTMLSSPIVFNGANTGIFSGAGRVVVLASGRLYNVTLPSGAVTDLGAYASPTHSNCESQAYWGVAEFSGGNLSVAYVQNSTTIVRTQVYPAGATSTIGTYTNLSDMCSFTVSTSAGRWYWHHEGGSQFGGSDESIGYCELAPRNCRGVASSTSGVYAIDPDGLGSAAPLSVYCDQTNDGGGWTLIGRMGDARLLPNLDAFPGAITAPGGTGNVLLTGFADIQGTDVRVGRQVGVGTNRGNFYQINDCTTGDAACWFARYIAQNDGDTYGGWFTSGGGWGNVPGGCTDDQCPTLNGDRDQTAAQRIAIFGGDCHASCNTNGDDTRNGLVYRDYGSSTAPARIGNRSHWSSGTVTSGSTALTLGTEIADYGQSGTAFRDIWIR